MRYRPSALVALLLPACHTRPAAPAGPIEWTVVALASGTADVTALVATSPTDAWAATAGPRLHHHDGATWTSVPMPTGSGRAIVSLAATTPADAWALAEDGTVLHLASGAWSSVPTAVAPGEHFAYAQRWPDELLITSDVPSSALHRFRDGVWSSAPGGILASAPSHPQCWGASPRDVWFAGGLADHFDGTTWTRVPVGDATLNAVHGSSSGDVWMVGGRGRGMGQYGWRGAAFHYDGARWRETAVPAGQLFLQRVCVVSPTEAYAVGDGASALRWDGVSWRRVRTGYETAPDLPVLDALACAPGRAWAGGRHVPLLAWRGSP